MNVLSLSYAVWNGREEAETFIDNLHSYIEKEIGLEYEIGYDIHYLSTEGDIQIDRDCIVFGQNCMPLVNTEGKVWCLPTVKTLTSDHPRDKGKRNAGRTALAEIVEYYKKPPLEFMGEKVELIEPQEVKTCIEYEGVTYGIVDVDVVIPQEQIEYLLKVKNLLDGGNVVVEVGDKKIRIHGVGSNE